MEGTSKVSEGKHDVADKDKEDEVPTATKTYTTEKSEGRSTSNFLPCSPVAFVFFVVLTVFASYNGKVKLIE